MITYEGWTRYGDTEGPVMVAVKDGDRTITMAGPFPTWKDAEKWEQEQIAQRSDNTK